MPPRFDKLDLYRRAVQHPEAEVRFLLEAYAHYRGRYPTRLREDFAGTAAVSAAWCDFADTFDALAIESHGPTHRWAARRYADRPRLRLIHADVLACTRPLVDVTAVLNFSIGELRTRDALLAYLRHARRCLRREGILVADLFGGPGAMTLGTQTRRVGDAHGSFTYLWEQRRYDHVTARIDCRIHFRVGHRTLRDAFVYDWRLWTPPELLDALRDAGFADAQVWCDPLDARGRSAGEYQPLSTMPARHDFVAYVVALR